MARRCKAINDYLAKKEDELTFKTGDLIYVAVRTPGDMWQGTLNGKTGYFPKVFVDDVTVEVKKAGVPSRVKALKPYTAENDSQLSFPEGAVMFVIAQIDENWFQGVYKGKAGLVPSSHVMDASDTATLKRKTGEQKEQEFKGLKCKAVRSHVPKEDGDLPFKVGDTIFVPKAMEDDHLWKGVCNGEIGMFPQHLVVDTAKMSPEEVAKVIEENGQSEEEKENIRLIEEMREKKKSALAAIKAEDTPAEDIAAPPPPPPEAAAAAVAANESISSAAAEEKDKTATASSTPNNGNNSSEDAYLSKVAEEPQEADDYLSKKAEEPQEADDYLSKKAEEPETSAPAAAAAAASAEKPAEEEVDESKLSPKELKAYKKKKEAEAKAKAKEEARLAKEEAKRLKEEEKLKKKQEAEAKKAAKKK